MYSLTDILTGAGLTAAPWVKNGASARITPGNQLLGTYAELLRFVAANAPYKGWEAHHILEAVDIDRLNLNAFAPAYEQQICVLLPSEAHKRINSVMRRSNPTSMSATAADLLSAYRTAYAIVGNYCGSSEAVVAAELIALVEASIKNLTAAAAAALAAALAQKLSDLTRLQNKIALAKGLHAALIKGSTAHTDEGVGAAVLSTIGAAVNALNPFTRPGLEIWANAEAQTQAAQKALAARDLAAAIAALAKGEGYYIQANSRFTAWRDGIELAGRKAQLVIGATAAVAVLLAVGAFLVLEAPVAVAVTTADGAAVGASDATVRQTFVRVAEGLDAGVKRIVLASTPAEEAAAEVAVEQSVEPLKRLFLPSP